MLISRDARVAMLLHNVLKETKLAAVVPFVCLGSRFCVPGLDLARRVSPVCNHLKHTRWSTLNYSKCVVRGFNEFSIILLMCRITFLTLARKRAPSPSLARHGRPQRCDFRSPQRLRATFAQPILEQRGHT